MPPTPPRLVTTKQAAELKGVDSSTIRRWVREGSLTPADTTAGGHYRFDPDHLTTRSTDAPQP